MNNPRALKLFYLALMLAAFPFDLSAQQESSQVTEIRAKAADHYGKKRFAEAAKLYRKVTDLKPGDHGAMRDLMWSLWHAGQIDEAVSTAADILKTTPKDLEAMNLLAQGQLNSGRREEAFATYNKSLSLDAAQITVRKALARLYENFKDYDKALDLCRGLLKELPNDAGVHAQIGRVQFRQGFYAQSLKSWTRALSLDPDNEDYKLNNAKALYFSGQTKLAQQRLDSIVLANSQNWAAVDFLVNSALVHGHDQTAFMVLENSLKTVSPENEPRLRRLSRIYSKLGRDEEYAKTLERELEINPDNGEALMGKAQHLLKLGRSDEAAEIYQEIARKNPNSIKAWTGLAQVLLVSSQTARAVVAIEQARRLDPTDPYLAILAAQYYLLSSDSTQGRDLILERLGDGKDETLPVLVYHGIARNSEDPMLASPTNISEGIFESHLKALSQAGFNTISIAQAVAWFNGQGDLPSRPLLLTFDEARLDSLRLADPLLKEYGFKAVMFAPLFQVDADLPGYASWKNLKDYQETGRWEIQAAGNHALSTIPVNKQGRMGSFFSNKMWLAEENRLENASEWTVRISSDYESGKERIAQRLGVVPAAFAFPDGNYGQDGIPNFPEAAQLNLELCRKTFSLCFHQDGHGSNVRTRAPALAARLEARQEWLGSTLVNKIQSEKPVVLMRRALARLYEHLKDYGQAIKYYRELLKDQPNDHGIYAQIARSNFYLGLYSEQAAAKKHFLESVSDWKKAISLAPNNPAYKVSKARALYFSGQHDLAGSELQDVLASNPHYFPAVDYMVDISSISGDFKTASMVLEESLVGADPSAEGRRMRLAQMYLALEMEDKYLQTVDHIIALNPKNGNALLEKASYLSKRGKNHEAIKVFKQVVRNNPNSIRGWNGMAEAYSASSQTASAVWAMGRAMRLDPTDPYRRIAYSRMLHENGDVAPSLLTKKSPLQSWRGSVRTAKPGSRERTLRPLES